MAYSVHAPARCIVWRSAPKRGDVLRLIFRQGSRLIALGLAWVLAGVAAHGFISSMLFGSMP